MGNNYNLLGKIVLKLLFLPSFALEYIAGSYYVI